MAHRRTHAVDAGLLTLPAAMILLTLASLAILSAAQPLVVEMRSASDHLRTVQAQHSAEAGQAWALSMLNAPAGAEASCMATAAAPTTLWRDQVLRAPELADASSASAIQPLGTLTSCTRTAAEWHCECTPDASGPPAGSAADDTTGHEGPSRFDLTWKAGPTAWTASLLSQACEGPSCRDGHTSAPMAGHAAVRQSFSRLGAWRQPLAAVLSAGARISLQNGVHVAFSGTSDAVMFHPPWALAAGQGVSMAAETLTGPPGTSANLLVQPAAVGLSTSVDGALRRLLDLPVAWWSRLPTVTPVPCPSTGCTQNELEPALTRGTAGIAVQGDLRLDTPGAGQDTAGTLSIGSESRPILLVVQGRVTIRARLHLRGALMAQEIDWSSPGPSSLTGAATAAAGLSLSGPIDVTHDAATLATLARYTPAWIPVAGTWEDVTDE